MTAAAVAATLTYDAATRIATLDPKADLAAGTQYTATLTGGATGIKSLTGTPLATATWNFTTAPGSAAPALRRHGRADGDRPYPGNQRHRCTVGGGVTATFSEPVQGVSGTTFTLQARYDQRRPRLSATVTYDATAQIATLKPNAALAANTQYTATADRRHGGDQGHGQQSADKRHLDLHHWSCTRHHRADGDVAEPE